MKLNADDLKWRGWFKQKARVAAIQLSCRLPGILQDFSWRGSIDPGILSTVSTVTAYAETPMCCCLIPTRLYLKIVVYDYYFGIFCYTKPDKGNHFSVRKRLSTEGNYGGRPLEYSVSSSKLLWAIKLPRNNDQNKLGKRNFLCPSGKI